MPLTATMDPESGPRDVFVCHNSADKSLARDFARRLADAGLSAWFDEWALVPGQEWQGALERALINCRAAVVLFGPAGLGRWGEAEARVCLDQNRARGMLVIPVLLPQGPGASALSPFLRQHHCVDLRAGWDEARLEGIVATVRGSPSPPSVLAATSISGPALYQLVDAPPLPAHYHPHPQLETIKYQLLGQDQAPVAVVGLQGMGGIGKTVLATALVHDPEVRRAFPNGIFWCRLGQHVAPLDLQQRQRRMIERLGSWTTPETLEQGRTQIADLTELRSCLFVLDDVWNEGDAEVLGRLGAGCKVLITTRSMRVSRILGAESLDLNPLTEPAAVALLARYACVEPATLPDEARQVVAECGGLPLALAMAASMVRGRPSDRWRNVLERFRRADLAAIEALFPGSPHRTLLAAIDVSVANLPEPARSCYLELAVFEATGPIPETTLNRFWGHVGLDELNVQDLVDTFVDGALARRIDDGRILLHDLQRDYVHRKQGDVRALDQRLIAAYRDASGGELSAVEDDGYIRSHLVFHLRRAGELDEAVVVVTGSPEWRERQRSIFRTERQFMNEIESCMTELRPTANGRQLPAFVGLHIALCMAQHEARIYEAADLRLLTLIGRVEEAVEIAGRQAYTIDKLRAIRGICEGLPEGGVSESTLDLIESALLDTVAASQKLQPKDHVEPIAALAQVFLRSGLSNRALNFLLAAERALLPSSTGSLASRFAEAGNSTHALELARQDGPEGLATLAETFRACGDAELARQAISAAADAIEFSPSSSTATERTRERVAADSRAIAILVEAGRIPQAKAHARTTGLRAELGRALAQLGESIAAETEFAEAKRNAAAIFDEFERCWALADLVAALRAAERSDEAYEFALELRTLAKFAWQRPRPGSGGGQTMARDWIAPLLHAGEIQVAGEIARQFRHPDDLTYALADVARAWASRGDPTRAIAAARTIPGYEGQHWSGMRVGALSDIGVKFAQQGKLDEALTVARLDESKWGKHAVEAAITAALARQRRFEEAEQQAKVIAEPRARAEALRSLVAELAVSGNLDEARQTFRVLQRTLTVKGTNRERYGHALLELSTALARAGEILSARAILNQAEYIVTGEISGSSKWALRRHLCRALVAVGQHERVVSVCDQILSQEGDVTIVDRHDERERVGTNDSRAYTVLRVVRDLVQAGMLQEARDAALRIKKEYFCSACEVYRVAGLATVAVADYQRGEPAQAQGILRAAADDLSRIASPLERRECHRILAHAYALCDLWPEARRLSGGADVMPALKWLPSPWYQGEFEYVGESSWYFSGRDSDTHFWSHINSDSLDNILASAAELDPDDLACRIFGCAEAFERISPNLTILVVREVVRILAWNRADWEDFVDLFPQGEISLPDSHSTSAND